MGGGGGGRAVNAAVHHSAENRGVSRCLRKTVQSEEVPCTLYQGLQHDFSVACVGS